jgi:hypothetical protein
MVLKLAIPGNVARAVLSTPLIAETRTYDDNHSNSLEIIPAINLSTATCPSAPRDCNINIHTNKFQPELRMTGDDNDDNCILTRVHSLGLSMIVRQYQLHLPLSISFVLESQAPLLYPP